MYNFITRLIQHHMALLKSSEPGAGTCAASATNTMADSEELRYSLTTLALARASLSKLKLLKTYPDYPFQIVVAGPTQVGKSVVVNLLLQQALAESSGQAGFTVHCQGFHVVDESRGLYSADKHWASAYFSDLRMSAQSSLDRQTLGEYSLQEIVSKGLGFENTVVWDTPDFDSIRSFDYRTPLVRSLALADLVVFVVSKEKYADRTVWLMLELLTLMKVRFVIVMNKTPVPVRAELQASLESKYNASLSQLKPATHETADNEIPGIGFIDEYPDDVMAAASTEELEKLRSMVLRERLRAEPSAVKANTVAFIKHHWKEWTASLSNAHRLHHEYEELVDRICTDSVKRYQAEYIDSERHREVMQLALSELLVLLEIPGMAKPLSRIRSAVTWPVRTLLSSAKEPSSVADDDRNEERRLLDELGKHATASLANSISIRETGADELWWRELRSEVEGAQAQVLSKYATGLDNYQTLLQVEIDRAAQSLYQTLQQQPATLNGLRAARVTADAAAVVLAVKSGGLGAVDLVVAPAMLSLTTLLTEGALGKYMDRIQKQLTDYQEKEVRSVVERKLRVPLLKLGRDAIQHSVTEDELAELSDKLQSGQLDLVDTPRR